MVKAKAIRAADCDSATERLEGIGAADRRSSGSTNEIGGPARVYKKRIGLWPVARRDDNRRPLGQQLETGQRRTTVDGHFD